MSKLIRSLTRALTVIEALNGPDCALSLNQLHQITQLDRATLLRILATLIEAGWVYRSLGDQCYRLSYQIHELGTHIRTQNSLAQLASPILDALQREVHWPSDLAIYNGTSMEIVETTRRQSPLFLSQGFMGYEPYMLQSAVGRAYLAWSHPRDQAAILHRLQLGEGPDAKLARNEAWVSKVLQATRDKGYAERDARYIGGPDDNDTYPVQVAAVPIMVLEEVQACINIVWLDAFIKPGQVEEELLPKLKAAADQIAQEIWKHELY